MISALCLLSAFAGAFVGFTETTTTSSAATRAAPGEVDVIEIPPESGRAAGGGLGGALGLEPPEGAESGTGSASAEDLLKSTTRSVRSSVRLDARFALDTRFNRDHPAEQIAELGVGARLELDIDIGSNLSAFVAPSFFHVTGLDRDGRDREALYLLTPETRVTWSLGCVDIRAGALLFNWGASDLVGPSDVLNPLDYRRNFVASIDEAKIPVIAAEVVLSTGVLTFRGVVEPFFTPSRFFLTGWDTNLAQATMMQGLNAPSLENFLGPQTLDDIGDRLILTERPKDRLDNATFAARATLTIDDLDLSTTVVHGWEPLPQIRTNGDLVYVGSVLADAVANRRAIDFQANPELFAALGRLQDALARGENVFEGTYSRRDLFGVDGVLALDPFILKFDISYSLARTAYTQDFQPVTHPWLLSVAGAEYVNGDEFQVIVEAFALTVFDVKSSYRLALIEPRAPPPSTTDAGERTLAVPGIAGIVRYGILEGDLRFEIAGVTSITRQDLLVMPAVHYRIDDAQQISLGGTIISGKRDGYGGAYSHNDQAYLHYQWTY